MRGRRQTRGEGESPAFPPFRDARATREALTAAASRCRAILTQNIGDFFLPRIVNPDGGYFEDERDGVFFDRGEKFLLMQARHLWFCGLLACESIRRDEALAAAAHGFGFLERTFRDRTHGGYVAYVFKDGRTAPTKRLYLQSFVLFALARYYMASGRSDALQSATALFDQLERHAHDPIGGGYL